MHFAGLGLTLLASACAGLAPLPALAGRPLQTDDAGVLKRGACELEGASTRLSAPAGSTRDNALQLGCGVAASSCTGC